MHWLLAALQKHQRRLKLENLLILLLRIAAVVLLGLALARLVVTDPTIAHLARPRRSVVLLLDTSYSTGARDGARAVSDRVRIEAERVLGSLGPDDALAVVVSNDVRPDRTGTRPFVLSPRGVGREAVSRAKDALSLLRPTEAPADWPAALDDAAPRKLLAPDDVNRALIWITDLQARDWKPPEVGKPDPLRERLEAFARDRDVPKIEIVDVGGSGPRALPNLSISEVSTTGDVFQGKRFALSVTVQNHSPNTVDGVALRVFLDDGATPARVVRVPPLPPANSTTLVPGEQRLATLDVDTPFATPGSHVVRAEITPPESSAAADALAIDSRRFLAIDVRATVKVLAWTEKSAGGNASPADAIAGVFTGEGSSDVFAVRQTATEDEFRGALGSMDPDLVVLANRVPGGAETQHDLLAAVRRGGALVVFVGDRFDPNVWNAAFYAHPEARLVPLRFGTPQTRTRQEEPWYVDLSAPPEQGAHELAKRWLGDATVRSWLQGVPPRIFGRIPLLPPEPPAPRTVTLPPAPIEGDDAVVMRFVKAQGDPVGQPAPVAIAQSRFGEGKTLLVATSLDDGWSAEALVLLFPVVLNDAGLVLTAGTMRRGLLVGQPIATSVPRDATQLRVKGPSRGEEAPALHAAADENAKPTAVFERVGASGIWRLTYEQPVRGSGAKRVEEAFAANVDPLESSLARASRDVVRAKGGDIRVLSSYEDVVAQKVEARQGEVTSWVLLAVALLLLLEPWLAMRFGRHGHTTASAARRD